MGQQVLYEALATCPYIRRLCAIDGVDQLSWPMREYSLSSPATEATWRSSCATCLSSAATTMLESSIRPTRSVPCGRVERLAVGVDDLLKSREKLPSSVALEPSVSAEAMDSDNSRPGRAKAGRTTATARASDSMMTSAPARTRAITPAKSRAASASEMRIVAIPTMIPSKASFISEKTGS